MDMDGMHTFLVLGALPFLFLLVCKRTQRLICVSGRRRLFLSKNHVKSKIIG